LSRLKNLNLWLGCHLMPLSLKWLQISTARIFKFFSLCPSSPKCKLNGRKILIETDETWLFDEEEEIGADELCVYEVEHDKDFVGNYYLAANFKSWKDDFEELPMFNAGIVMIDD